MFCISTLNHSLKATSLLDLCRWDNLSSDSHLKLFDFSSLSLV